MTDDVLQQPAKGAANGAASDPDVSRAESAVPDPDNWFLAKLEHLARRIGQKHLLKLVKSRGRLKDSLGEVPQKMHLVAAQTELVLELIDDFRDGVYREIPWHSVALIAGAILYAVSPADVIPDTIPVIGVLDDLAVVAVATRLVRGQLKAYARFKGYPLGRYFTDEI